MAAAAGKERQDAAYVRWLRELNRHACMGIAYAELRQVWREIGGQGILYYSRMYGPNRFGSWGHQHFAGDTQNPKNRAIEAHRKEAQQLSETRGPARSSLGLSVASRFGMAPALTWSSVPLSLTDSGMGPAKSVCLV